MASFDTLTAYGKPFYPSWIQVAGFKSLGKPARVELRPLTLLAGANSSGKSSMMQPLLLLKQTLEAPYEADPLVLNGDHVAFTSLGQLLSRGKRRDSLASEFRLGFGPPMLVGDEGEASLAPPRPARTPRAPPSRHQGRARRLWARLGRGRHATHSQLILRAMQTVVARGELTPEQVELHCPDPPPALRTEAQEAAFGQGGKRPGAEAWPRHVEHPDVQSDAAHTRDPKPNPRVGGESGHWFTRDPSSGWSTIQRAELASDGSFGDWPVDFPDIFAMADSAFLDAVFGADDSEVPQR